MNGLKESSNSAQSVNQSHQVQCEDVETFGSKWPKRKDNSYFLSGMLCVSARRWQGSEHHHEISQPHFCHHILNQMLDTAGYASIGCNTAATAKSERRTLVFATDRVTLPSATVTHTPLIRSKQPIQFAFSH